MARSFAQEAPLLVGSPHGHGLDADGLGAPQGGFPFRAGAVSLSVIAWSSDSRAMRSFFSAKFRMRYSYAPLHSGNFAVTTHPPEARSARAPAQRTKTLNCILPLRRREFIASASIALP